MDTKENLLVVDIGNTNIALGIFHKEKLQKSWRLASNTDKTADEYVEIITSFLERDGFTSASIKFCLLATVVPPLEQTFAEVFSKMIQKPAHFLKLEQIPMKDNLYNRYELGIDRLINSYAAFQKYKQPLIIIDFGTATTFDVVGQQGEYLGGVIMPGIRLAYDALNQKTAKLPKINFELPKKIIGKNTMESMQSGMFFGYIGMVNFCIDKIFNELGYSSLVLATGGDAELLKNESTKIQKIEAELTLFGLSLLYEKIYK